MSGKEFFGEKLEQIDVFALPQKELQDIYEGKIFGDKEKTGEEYLRNKDKIGFFGIADKFWKKINGSEKGSKLSKLNLIQGLWGSGKSTFVKILLLLVSQDKDWLGDRKFIPIVFNPRYIDQKNMDGAFFDLLQGELLQHRWDDKLGDSVGSLVSLMESVDNEWIKVFNGLLKFFQKSLSVDERIAEIADVINRYYNDVQLVIVIDEIDRLTPEKLMELGNLLDVIKRLSDMCLNKQVMCFFCWDYTYLSSIKVIGSETKTFEEYFSRFKITKLHIYRKSEEFFYKYISEVLFGYSDGQLVLNIRYLLDDLNESKSIPIVIRSVKSLFFTINGQKKEYRRRKQKDGIVDIHENQVITNDILLSVLYFLQIYNENESLYPKKFMEEVNQYIFPLGDAQKSAEEIRQRNFTNSFLEKYPIIKKVGAIDSYKSLHERAHKTFQYVDGFIKGDFNVFEKKERDLLYNEVALAIETDIAKAKDLTGRYISRKKGGNWLDGLDTIIYNYPFSSFSSKVEFLKNFFLYINFLIEERNTLIVSGEARKRQVYMWHISPVVFVILNRFCEGSTDFENQVRDYFASFLDTVGLLQPVEKLIFYKYFLYVSAKGGADYSWFTINFEPFFEQITINTFDFSFAPAIQNNNTFLYFFYKYAETLHNMMGSEKTIDDQVQLYYEDVGCTLSNDDLLSFVSPVFDFFLTHCRYENDTLAQFLSKHFSKEILWQHVFSKVTKDFNTFMFYIEVVEKRYIDLVTILFHQLYEDMKDSDVSLFILNYGGSITLGEYPDRKTLIQGLFKTLSNPLP